MGVDPPLILNAKRSSCINASEVHNPEYMQNGREIRLYEKGGANRSLLLSQMEARKMELLHNVLPFGNRALGDILYNAHVGGGSYTNTDLSIQDMTTALDLIDRINADQTWRQIQTLTHGADTTRCKC